MVEVSVSFRGRIPANKFDEFLLAQEKLAEDEDTLSVEVNVLNAQGTQTLAHHSFSGIGYDIAPDASPVPDTLEEVGNDTPEITGESDESSPESDGSGGPVNEDANPA